MRATVNIYIQYSVSSLRSLLVQKNFGSLGTIQSHSQALGGNWNLTTGLCWAYGLAGHLYLEVSDI